MHPGQITALTGALAATIVTLVAYMMIKSGDPSKSYKRSTWHLTIHDEGVDQTWYIDTEINAIKIVQEDSENGSIDVQELHAGAIYDYSVLDPNLDLTITTEACDDVDLSDFDGSCEDYVASLQADIFIAAAEENKDECSETTLLSNETMTIAASLPCDGTAEVGMFLVSFIGCVPTAILDADNSVVATINSVVDGIDDSVTFSKCDTPEVDTDNQRKLGMFRWVERLISQTGWCGANTKVYDEDMRCPGDPDVKGGQAQYSANRACRRHDMGLVVGSNRHLFGQVHKLECSVDKKLVDWRDSGGTDNWVVQAIFGKYGMSMAWGCYDLQFGEHCKWRHAWWGWYRECNTVPHWVTKRWWRRYDNVFDRKEKCNSHEWDGFNKKGTLISPVTNKHGAFNTLGKKGAPCFHRCDVYSDTQDDNFSGQKCPDDDKDYIDENNFIGTGYSNCNEYYEFNPKNENSYGESCLTSWSIEGCCLTSQWKPDWIKERPWVKWNIYSLGDHGGYGEGQHTLQCPVQRHRFNKAYFVPPEYRSPQ